MARRPQDRQAQVALPAGPPRHVGLRHSRARRSWWTSPSTAKPIKARRAANQAGVGLRVRSRDRAAGVADRGTAGREGRRAGRVVFADAAVRRPSRRRSSGRASTMDDLIDFTPELRAEAIKVASRYKMGPLFTPPVVSKWPGPLGTLMLPNVTRRRELAGRIVRSRDEACSTSSRNAGVRSLGLVPSDAQRDRTCDFIARRGARSQRAPAGRPPAARPAGGRWRVAEARADRAGPAADQAAVRHGSPRST